MLVKVKREILSLVPMYRVKERLSSHAKLLQISECLLLTVREAHDGYKWQLSGAMQEAAW